MTQPQPPWRQKEFLAELYYMDARARVLDLAAFLDRLDRAEGQEDHRLRSLRAALLVLAETKPNRVARLLEAWSDPTSEPVTKADNQRATGSWPGA